MFSKKTATTTCCRASARNDGEAGFRDVTGETGTADVGFGMGVSWGDYDGDGRQDLYVSNMFSKAGERITAGIEGLDARFAKMARGNTLFRNLGDGRFEDVTMEAGVAMGRWAWGALFTDFQNDGLPDLVVPNGFVTGEDQDDL